MFITKIENHFETRLMEFQNDSVSTRIKTLDAHTLVVSCLVESEVFYRVTLQFSAQQTLVDLRVQHEQQDMSTLSIVQKRILAGCLSSLVSLGMHYG